MNSIKELFKYIKFAPFITHLTGINLLQGIKHRKNGRGLGTEKNLTKDDLAGIDSGLEKLQVKIVKVREEISGSLNKGE